MTYNQWKQDFTGEDFSWFNLRLAKKKTDPDKSILSVLIKKYRENKIKALNSRKAPGGGVFIFASLAEKDRIKTPSPWGFSRETPVYYITWWKIGLYWETT